MEGIENSYGRLFLKHQLPKEVNHLAKTLESIVAIKGKVTCQRCHYQITAEARLPSGTYYCRFCLVFGRNQADRPLYYIPPHPFPIANYLQWKGILTPYQESISNQLVKNVHAKKPTLVHAVTGAGKTEMIYGAIAAVVNAGGWVCLASPRVDVCIELANRLKAAFSCRVTLLHADSEAYQRSPIIVATTHQLLTFYKAFDLLIIDEVDAFPFVNNHQLQYAAQQAAKEGASSIVLTATSTKELEEQVKSGELEKLTLARRFHDNPLILPKFIRSFGLLKIIHCQKLPRALVKSISQQRKTGCPLLIFLPIIAMAELVTELLKLAFPEEQIACVSSQSADRVKDIDAFRQGKKGILVTTTILERGVTFPGVDVFVLMAQHRGYSSQSLVQIAGRVGRSIERPTGKVYFFHDGISQAMRNARKEIKEMNQKGYLNDMPPMSTI